MKEKTSQKCSKKVVCVANPGKGTPSYSLTIGKVYQVNEVDAHFIPDVYYRVIDDEYRNFFYNANLFKDLSEVRDERIDSIINT